MTRLIIQTGTEADFFRRGLELARTADRGGEISPMRIVSFEDPAEIATGAGEVEQTRIVHNDDTPDACPDTTA